VRKTLFAPGLLNYAIVDTIDLIGRFALELNHKHDLCEAKLANPATFDQQLGLSLLNTSRATQMNGPRQIRLFHLIRHYCRLQIDWPDFYDVNDTAKWFQQIFGFTVHSNQLTDDEHEYLVKLVKCYWKW